MIRLMLAFTMTHSEEPAEEPEPRAEADPLHYFDYPELFDGPAARQKK